MSTHPGPFQFRIPSGAGDRWSRRALALLGREEPPTLQELLGEIVHEEDRPAAASAFGLAATREGPFDLTFRVVLPDGEVRELVCAAESERAGDGEGVVVLGALAERGAAGGDGDSPREREILLEAAFQTQVEGIVTIDSGGTVLSFNPGAERMFGYSGDEVVGRNVSMLMPSPDREEHDGFLERYRETGISTIVGGEREVTGRRRDGKTFPMELSVSEVVVAGRRRFTGILRDLSAKKRLEEQFLQAQKMEAVGRLAGGIAHDFNNLLMGVMGCCRSAASFLPEDHPAREDVEEIRRAVEGGATMTRQLLDFSRRRRTLPEAVEVDAEVRSSQTLLAQLLDEDVELSIYPYAPGATVLAAPGQIEQVLMNLVVNSRDAMQGAGEVRIATRALAISRDDDSLAGEDAAGDYVMIEISDTGAGMSAEVQARALEPFFTTKEPGKGTGLGLSTVYGIVTGRDGFLRIESEPGEGTTVRIYLPQVGMARPKPIRTVPEERINIGGSETVLVVEDERLVRKAVLHYLEGLGYEVLEAASPAEALEKARAREEPIHLVLTDIVMPGMYGRELAKSVAKIHPGIRAVYMSAYPEEVLLEQGRIDEGMPTLEKPFHLRDLQLKVREVLDEVPA